MASAKAMRHFRLGQSSHLGDRKAPRFASMLNSTRWNRLSAYVSLLGDELFRWRATPRRGVMEIDNRRALAASRELRVWLDCATKDLAELKFQKFDVSDAEAALILADRWIPDPDSDPKPAAAQIRRALSHAETVCGDHLRFEGARLAAQLGRVLSSDPQRSDSESPQKTTQAPERITEPPNEEVDGPLNLQFDRTTGIITRSLPALAGRFVQLDRQSREFELFQLAFDATVNGNRISSDSAQRRLNLNAAAFASLKNRLQAKLRLLGIRFVRGQIELESSARSARAY